jgi:hypothetical protein
MFTFVLAPSESSPLNGSPPGRGLPDIDGDPLCRELAGAIGIAPEVRDGGCCGGFSRLPALASLENASFVGGVACVDRAGCLESCCCLAPSVASPGSCPEVPVVLFHRSANASIRRKRKGQGVGK